MNIKAILAIFGVFLGCWSSVVFLEYIVTWVFISILSSLIIFGHVSHFRYDPGAGNLVTFLQFFFIASYGLIFTSKFFTVARQIPMKEYSVLVIMFFVSNCVNNYALNYNISMPLNLIFRSSTLLANMVLGIAFFKKRYDWTKYVSVVSVTMGIFLCTYASGTDIKSTALDIDEAQKDDGNSAFFWWSIGVTLMSGRNENSILTY